MNKKKESSKKVKKEVESPINESSITNSQIEEAMWNLAHDNQYWPYLTEYIAGRVATVDQALQVIDPFKEPTQMARSQGIRSGLNDIFELIDIIREKKEEAIRAEKEKSGKSTGTEDDVRYDNF